MRAVELFERCSGRTSGRPAAAVAAGGSDIPRTSGHAPNSSAALSGLTLTTILRTAWDTHYRQWPAERHGDCLTVLVAVLAVAGLPRGLYPTGRPDGSLLPAQSAPAIDRLVLCYPGGRALLLVCGNVRQAACDGDSGGYGGLLVRAGALGHALWRSATLQVPPCSADAAASALLTHVVRRADPGLRHLLTVVLHEEGDEDA